jgi:hypothetical protein
MLRMAIQTFANLGKNVGYEMDLLTDGLPEYNCTYNEQKYMNDHLNKIHMWGKNVFCHS